MVFATAFMLAVVPASVSRAQQQSAPPESSTPQSVPPQSTTPQPSAPQSAPLPSPGDASASQGRQGIQIDSRSLVGSTVRGEDGKDLGKVANLMIDANDGKVTALIITVGRTLGGTGITLGGKDITVPWSAIKLAHDQQNVIVTLQQPMMPSASPPSTTR
jgi:sporulation protein YlmC with PRC-barrel domain